MRIPTAAQPFLRKKSDGEKSRLIPNPARGAGRRSGPLFWPPEYLASGDADCYPREKPGDSWTGPLCERIGVGDGDSATRIDANLRAAKSGTDRHDDYYSASSTRTSW